MISSQELRRRIESIGSTAQLTKAMQMVAASKVRKAQSAALATHPFMRLIYRMQRQVTMHAIDFSHPLLEVREVRKRAVILIGADKGLCGSLNTNLFRSAAEFDSATTVFIAAGRKAAQFVARSGRQLAAEFTDSDVPRVPEARAIAIFARDLFLKGDVDQVQIVATRFVNTLVQQTVTIEFLPVGQIKGLKLKGAESEEQLSAHEFNFLFEPNPENVLSYLISHYLNIYIYQVLLDAKASEHSARMVAMKNATENADGLIKDLTLEYNKRRQENITNELLDISGGEAAGA
jgi:F-type H+-transporting ATPase subunit gamma